MTDAMWHYKMGARWASVSVDSQLMRQTLIADYILEGMRALPLQVVDRELWDAMTALVANIITNRWGRMDSAGYEALANVQRYFLRRGLELPAWASLEQRPTDTPGESA